MIFIVSACKGSKFSHNWQWLAGIFLPSSKNLSKFPKKSITFSPVYKRCQGTVPCHPRPNYLVFKTSK
jgi:hypothetical protein